jgi:predicted DNA-binding transcriptional regulator AlpA
MPTAEDIAEGFFRYDDLQKLKIVTSRSDLHDKQENLGFPRPIKPSRKVALFLRSEVIEWLLGLVAKRDAKHPNACKLIEMAQTAESDAKRHELSP